MSERARAAGRERPFVGKVLARFQRTLLAGKPAATDPLLRLWTPIQQGYVEGGMCFYELSAYATLQDAALRRDAERGYRRTVPRAVRPVPEAWIR
jgi:hypothetical protein